jgi:hypothetical protein
VRFGAKWSQDAIRTAPAQGPDLEDVVSAPITNNALDFGSMYEKDLAALHDEILRQELERNL